MNATTEQQVEWEEIDHGMTLKATLAHGITVRIQQEESNEFGNPREWDQLGHMMCAHRDYHFGDEQGYPNRVFTCEDCEGSGWVPAGHKAALDGAEPDEDGDVTCATCGGDGDVELDWYSAIMREHKATVILPLFIYDHSGVSMWAGQRMGSIEPRGQNPFDSAAWDTSMVGFIFDTPERHEALGTDPANEEETERQLRGEIEEYDWYLRGYVYYYVVEDANETMLDSCGGFLDGHVEDDEKSHTKMEALAAARSAVEDAEQEIERARHWAERDVVTVDG